jgi:WD40 repeat protein
LQQFIGHEEDVRKLVALNGARLATSSDDTTVRVWDIKSGKCVCKYEGHLKEIYEIRRKKESHIREIKEICPKEINKGINDIVALNNDMMASVGSNATTVHIWNASTGAFIRKFRHKNFGGTEMPTMDFSFKCALIRCLAVLGDGTLVSVGYYELDKNENGGYKREPHRDSIDIVINRLYMWNPSTDGLAKNQSYQHYNCNYLFVANDGRVVMQKEAHTYNNRYMSKVVSTLRTIEIWK